MGLWNRIKQATRKVVSKVQQFFTPGQQAQAPPPPAQAPAQAQAPAPNPFAATFQQTKTGDFRGVSSAQQTTSSIAMPSGGGGGQFQAPAQAQPQQVAPPLPPDSQFGQMPAGPGAGEPDPFLSLAGQEARIKNAVSAPFQALMNQFGLNPAVEADSALVKWLANNPLFTAAPPALLWAGGTGIITHAAGVATVGTGATIQMAANTATGTLAHTVLQAAFSQKALLFFGAWAAAVGFGLWGQAESPESPVILISQHMVDDAERTEDWSLVDEAMESARDVSNMSNWEKFWAATPFGPIAGSLSKLEGNLAGIEVLQQLIDDKKQQQIDGTTEADYWKQRDLDEIETQRIITQNRIDESKKLLLWEEGQRDRDAKEDKLLMAQYNAEQRAAVLKQRNDNAAFWEAEREKQFAREAEDRIAVAQFWLNYKKMAAKIDDDNRPSNLNFGLL